jgi:hypothetical protein
MNKHDRKWNMQYEKLVELKRKTGHCLVPRNYEQARSLRTWVSTQRKTNNDNTIRLDRKERLEEIGFAWEDVCGFKPDDKKWNKQHEKLLKFKGINGHCMVPQSYEQDKSLGIWASTQRTFHKTNQIRLDRKERLEEIEFGWKADGDKLWHQQYEKIVELKRKTGHCLVSRTYEQDKSLGIWASTQRGNNNNDNLRPDRKRLLDEIGFAWKVEGAHKDNDHIEKIWHQNYEKLVEFKRMNSHCRVPLKYEQDKSLGRWVGTQRNYHNNNQIRHDRKELLDRIGFAWKASALADQLAPMNVRGLVI